jgi:hypothetical protein
MRDPLARVKRAAEAKRRAELEYRSALQAARNAGHSAAEIAKSAGVTRQAARQALLRLNVPPTHEPSRETMEARLAELDSRWELLIDELAEVERPPDAYMRRETAKRNGRRGKDARKGLASRPTVGQETRSFAEAKLLSALRRNPNDARVVALVRELDEANALRQALEAGYDSSLGITD